MAFSASYALALAAVFLVQGSNAGHIRRSADNTTPLQELMDNAKAQMQTVAEDLSRFMQATNFDEFKALVESKTKELEDRAKSVMDELKRQYEVHGPEMSEKASAALNEATAHINATLENLKTQAPGAMQEISAMHQRFTDTLKNTAETLYEETGKVAKAAGEDATQVHTAFTNISRTALTQTMDIMQQMHNDVQQALKRAAE